MQQERTDNGCEKRQWYKETGSFYIFRKAALGMKHILDAAPKRIYEDIIDIDIDTPEDLRRAEKI
jgi:CMP-N-acetylneuraminic acid synthetase